jgi:TetR/AcrR family transcriptional regulator, regulator of autoinduction and epiphytic fitness
MPPTKKRIDGRTAKGLKLREQAHESILSAYIDLIRGGVPLPTARETAAHAGLSLRVVFNHFPDLQTLRLAAFKRAQAESSEFFSANVPPRGTAAERIAHFVESHTRRLELVAPFHRAAAMIEATDPQATDAMRRARNSAARDLETTLGPTLAGLSPEQRRALLTRLHMVCSWESWNFLRAHYRLPAARARAVVIDVALAVLAAAGRRARRS